MEVLGVKIVEKPGIYLGANLDFLGRKSDLFKRVLNRVEDRLANWKWSYLVFAGRVTLVKHVLSTIPIYLFSNFRAPLYFLNQMRSIIITFLWGRGDRRGISWMRWDDLCKPMEQGGLGLRDLGCFNQALLAKAAWRLWVNRGSLVAKILVSIVEGRVF